MLPAIEQDTGWSRSSITFAITCGSIGSGLVSPFFGRLADSYGPRFLSAAALVIVALLLLIIATSSYVGIALFYFGYICSRTIGQNVLVGVVPRTTAVNWFKRMRGRALGFVSMANPLGGAALVPIAGVVSDRWGWQYVYFGAAVLFLLILAPLAMTFLRRRPEDLGLLPDGDDSSAPSNGEVAEPRKHVSPGGEIDWTLQQAMRTRAFWLLIAAITVGTCASGGVGFHQAAYYQDQGIAVAAAALAVSTYALSGAFANALWGFILERVSERIIGAATVAGAGALCLYLLTVDSAGGALIFAFLFGIMARGETSIIVMIQAQYYGRNSFGAISGFSTPFQQISLGLGPTVGALIYDLSGGSYTLAFLLFGTMFMLGAIFLWCARRPEPSAEMLAAHDSSRA